MARSRAPGRLEEILDAAADVFIANGYRLARIDAIASQAGVAPATIHLYAATKAGLFDLAMRRALHDPSVHDEPLPYHAPSPRATVDRIWLRLLATAHFPVLRSIGPAVPHEGVDAELRSVIGEAYRWLREHRRALLLIERCAADWPELASLFETQFRREFLNRLTAFLERRARQGVLRTTPDAAIAARVMLEVITWSAVRRHETSDHVLDESSAQHVILDLVSASLRQE